MPAGLPGTATGRTHRVMHRGLGRAPSGYGSQTTPDQGGHRADTPAHHHRAPAALRRRMGLQPSRAADLSRHSVRIRPAVHGRRRGGAVPRRPAHRGADQRLDGRPGARRAGRRDGGARAARLPARAHHRASATARARRSTRSTACGARSSPRARGCSARARIRRPPRATRRSPTRSATSASATCSATPWPRRSAACTSTSGCRMPRRRSAPSTGCAATCRCCRRWPPTRPSATVATPAWPRRAR